MKFDKHVQIREEKFGTVIFETLREKVFVTNCTGADIIRSLQGERSSEEVVKELAMTYGTDASVIAADVNAFIEQLKQNQVLV